MSAPYRVLDLFSAAAGGWSLGMHRAGFMTIAACEVEAWRRQLYQANNPGVKVYDDVRTLTASRLLDDLGRLPDIIVGSPPCQDLSAANPRGRGVEGIKSGLYFEAIRVIGEVRPRWFALENSDRLRTKGFDRVADELEDLGYYSWPLVVGVGNAGGSHQRKRVWVVGLDANADWADGALSGPDRGRWSGRQEARGGTRGHLGADSDSRELRIEHRLGEGRLSDGKEEIVAGLARIFRGPVGSADLGSHLRAYDGLPGWVAERCREAYGDAVCPQIPEAIGRAILRVEAALAAVSERLAA